MRIWSNTFNSFLLRNPENQEYSKRSSKTGELRAMIVECKNCSQRYNFNEIHLKPNGSKVKCIKCGNIFVAYPPSRPSQKNEAGIKGADRLDAITNIYVLASNDKDYSPSDNLKKTAFLKITEQPEMIRTQNSPKQPKITIDLRDGQQIKKRRIGDPFLDRRSGDDRREAYELGYFAEGSIEKRKSIERRQKAERRDQYVRISQWSSVLANSK
jgi:predicted Zn finger-like uncharacterized protein